MVSMRKMQRDETRLKKLNQRATRKVKRIQNVYGVNTEIQIRDLSTFTTRKEYNQYVKELESFTHYQSNRYVKNDYGDVFKYEDVQRVKNEYKKANERLKRTEKRLTGKTNNNKKSLMNDGKFATFEPRKPNLNKVNPNTLSKLIEHASYVGSRKHFQQVFGTYKSNYLKALKTEFHGKAKMIEDIVKNMSDEQFATLYYNDYNDALNIEFMYDEFAMFDKLGEIITYFESKGFID